MFTWKSDHSELFGKTDAFRYWQIYQKYFDIV